MRSLDEIEVALKLAIGVLLLALTVVSWLAFARHPTAGTLRAALLNSV
jgi:hypothetical protein